MSGRHQLTSIRRAQEKTPALERQAWRSVWVIKFMYTIVREGQRTETLFQSREKKLVKETEGDQREKKVFQKQTA
jgi:hypothetical protein